MNKIPVVIDCDPGTDDALAILMVGAAKNIEIKAITTVAGNLNQVITAKNALMIADYFGIDVPVTKGAYPLMKQYEPLDISVCGVSGLGRAVLPEPTKNLDSLSSAERLYQCVLENQGKIRILAIGPLTNIALLIRTHPEVCTMIDRIVMMGGAIDGGNITPKAEFNIYTDAEAAKIVFGAGIPITMIGLDVSYDTPVYEEELAKLLNTSSKARDFIAGILYYPGTEERPFPKEGIFIYDALAATALIDPDSMTMKKHYVDVETKGEITYGQTVVDYCNYLKKKPNVDVCYHCRKERFLGLIQETIAFYQ